MRSVSVNYGIMKYAENLYVLAGTFSWDIEGGEKLIATVGLDDVVIIDTQDVVLVADKQHIGDIKNVLEEIRINRLEEKYL